MLKFNLSPAEIEAAIRINGLPFQDCLAPYVSDLIQEYYPDFRDRIFNPLVVMGCMIASIMSGGESLSQSVIRINAERTAQKLPPVSTNTAGFSKARTRLPQELIEKTAINLALDSEKAVPQEWTWRGMKGFLIDGTTFTADDTIENQEKFPQHGAQQEGLGFPILRAVVIQSLTTGMIMGAQYDSYKGKETGEMALVRSLQKKILEGDFLVGDRYYPSFFFMCFLIQNKKHGVFQSHGSRNVDFRKGQKIGNKDHIVTWRKPAKPEWMSQEEYKRHPDTIEVREVEVKGASKRHSRMVLVTTFLDAKKFSKDSLCGIYKKRWKIELALRDIKSTLGMDHFYAKNIDMISKLFWCTMLTFNCIRWHMMVAAKLGKRVPQSLSFKAAASVIDRNLMNILNASRHELPKVLASMYWQILQSTVGHRKRQGQPRGAKKKRRSPPLKVARKKWQEKQNVEA